MGDLAGTLKRGFQHEVLLDVGVDSREVEVETYVGCGVVLLARVYYRAYGMLVT